MMNSLRTFLFQLTLAICLGCQPPDCYRKDCGTCGNSCCSLNVYIDKSTELTYNQITATLKNGGPDSRYTFKNGYDMRKDNATADFILQGWHQTLTHRYNDTLDFTIIPQSDDSSLVVAFSISQIATAYCDDGQNYKNLAALVKALNLEYREVVTYGCPQNG